MNIAKVLLLLFFLILIVGIIAPAQAKLDSSLELQSTNTVKGKTKLYFTVNSDQGILKDGTFYTKSSYNVKRKKELDSVNKIIISVKGQKNVTFKKPKKGWEKTKYNFYFDKTFSVKGKAQKINNKQYSIKFYNEKNKVFKTKKGRVQCEWYFSERDIHKNPKKYFDKLKSKNKKNSYVFTFLPSKKTNSIKTPTGNISATSSDVNYYYNPDSLFNKEETTTDTYYSRMYYPVKKAENKKNYTDGEYTIYTSTYKIKTYGKWWKHVEMVRKVNKTGYSSVKNPYFTVSEKCNWKDPLILSIANSIKANITRSNYATEDMYRMELANAVIRYLHINIKYDYSFSKDQTAVSTLQRGYGTCYGNTMLAGALLRAVGIPVYFESSYKDTGPENEIGHTWPVTFIFYGSTYQWLPADGAHYYGNDTHYLSNSTSFYNSNPNYLYPFYFGAVDWWNSQSGICITYKGYSDYYY